MILCATNLCKTFFAPHRVQVLTNVSLSAKRGDTIAISGRSGEGKTTLLHLLGALEPADEGEIILLGERVTPKNSVELRKRHIGFIFQSYNLLEDFTVLENILMPARIARRSVDLERGYQLLEEVGLRERAEFPIKLLSGGERQRAAIVRALYNDPDLLLADEPTGNLDHVHAKQIGETLLSCALKHNKTLILVTHDQELANLCTYRYTLQNSKLEPFQKDSIPN